MFVKATGFKNREDEDSYDVDGTSLFRVRGTCPEDVMTTQIQPEVVRTKLILHKDFERIEMHLYNFQIFKNIGYFSGVVSLH